MDNCSFLDVGSAIWNSSIFWTVVLQKISTPFCLTFIKETFYQRNISISGLETLPHYAQHIPGVKPACGFSNQNQSPSLDLWNWSAIIQANVGPTMELNRFFSRSPPANKSTSSGCLENSSILIVLVENSIQNLYPKIHLQCNSLICMYL